MAQKFAQMLGQNASQAATLLDHDILGDYPNKDQISSLYNMAYHADKVCTIYSGSTPRYMTAAQPLELMMACADILVDIHSLDAWGLRQVNLG